MKDSKNLDGFGLDPIDDTVAAVNHLPHRVIPYFRDDASGKRKSIESFHGRHDTFDEKLSVSYKIAGYVFTASTSSSAWSVQMRVFTR